MIYHIAAELPRRHVLLKHVVEVLQCPSFHLWNAEESEKRRAHGEAAEYEPNFGLEIGVRRIQEIRSEEGEEEATRRARLASPVLGDSGPVLRSGLTWSGR